MVELSEWRNGLLNELLLTVPQEGAWEDVLGQVEAQLEGEKTRLSRYRAQLTLHFGLRAVSLPALTALVERLKTEYGLLTVAVVSTDTVTQEAARQLMLNAYMMLPGSTKATSEREIDTGNNALYLPHTVRSGQRIVHRGTIVVGSDVNAGAEVIATGDILIFGTLRGLAHAGCEGDEKARIVAGNMRPQQLRIAAQIARSPEDAKTPIGGTRNPEVARIEDGIIQVSPV
ncbi:MAG TPA: septum site-determining protein MinC [Chthonomonadaceae bacterium]|nr:septum site-determining protein MinC [Chthonomonadaceae bacterium]